MSKRPSRNAHPPTDATSPTLLSAARALCARDLRLLWRRRGDALQPALFTLLVIVLFALSSDPRQLSKIGAGVVWVAALLSGLLALDHLFRNDLDDGSLEQWLLSSTPLAWIVFVRTAFHWFATTAPLLIALPLFAELLQLPVAQSRWLFYTLLLGTPLLNLLGAIVAALTIGMRRSGILMALLALPLYVPVLVFGVGSTAMAAQGLDASSGLLMLGAGLALAVILAPLTAAAAIRIVLSGS